MPHEMRELDEQGGQEAAETFRDEDGDRKRSKDAAIKQNTRKSEGVIMAQESPKTTLGKGRNMFAEAYLEILDQPAPGDKKGRTYIQLIALRNVTRAARGEARAATEIADRIGGKPFPAVPTVEAPVEEEAELNLGALSIEQLRTMDALLDIARPGQQDKEAVIAINEATKLFVEAPTEYHLQMLQHQQNGLVAAKLARDKARLNRQDSEKAEIIDALPKRE